jgi:hypothetical protein
MQFGDTIEVSNSDVFIFGDYDFMKERLHYKKSTNAKHFLPFLCLSLIYFLEDFLDFVFHLLYTFKFSYHFIHLLHKILSCSLFTSYFINKMTH